MLDHAQAGDGVKGIIGEWSLGKIAGQVLNRAAACWTGERKIDPVEITITIDKQRRQNIAVKLRPTSRIRAEGVVRARMVETAARWSQFFSGAR